MVCSVCGHRTKRADHLRQHVRKKHPEIAMRSLFRRGSCSGNGSGSANNNVPVGYIVNANVHNMPLPQQEHSQISTSILQQQLQNPLATTSTTTEKASTITTTTTTTTMPTTGGYVVNLKSTQNLLPTEIVELADDDDDADDIDAEQDPDADAEREAIENGDIDIAIPEDDLDNLTNHSSDDDTNHLLIPLTINDSSGYDNNHTSSSSSAKINLIQQQLHQQALKHIQQQFQQQQQQHLQNAFATVAAAAVASVSAAPTTNSVTYESGNSMDSIDDNRTTSETYPRSHKTTIVTANDRCDDDTTN